MFSGRTDFSCCFAERELDAVDCLLLFLRGLFTNGIYNDEHIKEEEEVYNTGIKLPYLIIKKSKQKNKPPTVYINYMFDNTGISSPVDHGIVEPI